MKSTKAPRFTLKEGRVSKDDFGNVMHPGITTITDRDGNVGEVYREGESYLVKLTECKTITPSKAAGLSKRMADWYYFTHVKGKE